jgi:hypothetical protein
MKVFMSSVGFSSDARSMDLDDLKGTPEGNLHATTEHIDFEQKSGEYIIPYKLGSNRRQGDNNMFEVGASV